MGLERQEVSAEKKALEEGGAIIRLANAENEGTKYSVLTKDGLLAEVSTKIPSGELPVLAAVYPQVLELLVPAELKASLISNGSCSLSERQNQTVADITETAYRAGIKVHPDSDTVVVPVTKIAEDLAKAVKECEGQRI